MLFYIYGQDPVVDIHAETCYCSYPEKLDRSTRYNKLIKITVKKEKLGKQSIHKLVIGTTHFNILATCSMVFSPTHARCVTVGPSGHSLVRHLDYSFAQILLQNTSIKLLLVVIPLIVIHADN